MVATLSKKISRTAAIAGVVGLVLSSFGLPASAAVSVFKDSQGAVYVSGLTPSSGAPVTFNNVPKTRNALSNACGLLVIRNSTNYPIGSTITVGSTAITTGTLTTETVPSCNNGTLEVPRASNFKTADGSVVAVGLTASTQYPITYNGSAQVRNATANACGFIRLTSNARFPLTGTISIGGTSYNLSSVPTQNPPLCRGGVLYNPATP
jgi:hypothetical protein